MLKAREATQRSQKAKLPIGNKEKKDAEKEQEEDQVGTSSSTRKLSDAELIAKMGGKLSLVDKATSENAKE